MAFQRQNWQPTDSGILRKKEENEEELLVFGYSCKLFRDDEKALYVDQGKHLIPWMGDDALRIDRYDVRGALADLAQYEAMSGQQEEMLWVNLSSEERRIEQLCDQERYRALTHNEDEERLYQEEELKRLHQALGSDKTYGQVSYSYDEENGVTEKPVDSEQSQMEELDEPFVAPAELDLPPDMVVPDTMKLNAIIEKTVMFINQQGSQMEIILKMKQAANPQFEFLSYNSPLHSYYRHLTNAVKSGKYKPKPPSNPEPNSAEEDGGSSENNHYLHHSLSQGPQLTFNLAPSIPSINYKPSSDCAYSMLVNKIKNNQNKLLSQLTDDITSDSFDLREGQVSPRVDLGDDKAAQSGLPRAARRKRRKRQQGGFAYNDSIDGVEYMEDVGDADAHMGQVPEYEMPALELQLIIDKMASYVGKNGRSFEEIVKSKNDSRFSFLDSTNVYHAYYRRKLEMFEQSVVKVESSVIVKNYSSVKKEEKESVENGNDVVTISANPTSVVSKTSSKPQPVCFSIKRPKETESLEIKSALPVEESSDEGEENDEEMNCDGVEVVRADVGHIEVVESKSKDVSKSTADKSKDAVDKSGESKKQKKGQVNLTGKEKEKQKQLERKKRAAAFLNLIQKVNKTENNEEEEESVMIGPQLPEVMKVKGDSISGDDDEEDSDSVSSAPSSVTSPDVTIVGEIVASSPKPRSCEVSGSSTSRSARHAEKRLGHRDRGDVEYRHRHRKRKRSRTYSHKHHSPYAQARSHYNRSKEEVKRRKHRKDYDKRSRDHSGVSNDCGGSVSASRRHKHSKLKKQSKRKDKYVNKSSSSTDSDVE